MVLASIPSLWSVRGRGSTAPHQPSRLVGPGGGPSQKFGEHSVPHIGHLRGLTSTRPGAPRWPPPNWGSGPGRAHQKFGEHSAPQNGQFAGRSSSKLGATPQALTATLAEASAVPHGEPWVGESGGPRPHRAPPEWARDQPKQGRWWTGVAPCTT